jgi:hypothetical protein
MPDCQSCYQSIDCYPECSECTCGRNGFGCVTCYCRYPVSNMADESTSNGCEFPSCEACIAAFPCIPGPCSTTDCSLNEFGCPVCSTAQ